MRFIDRAFPRLHAEIIRDLWGPMGKDGGDGPESIDWVERLLRCGASPNKAGYREMRPLHLAAGRPSEDMVELLLERGADPTKTDKRGRSPMDYAARRRNAMTPEREIEACGIIELLAGVGADPDGECCGRYWRPLHRAIASGSVKMVTALARAGANLDRRGKGAGARPIHVAALHDSADAARALLVLGADPDSVDDEGNTALHVAAHAGNLGTIRALLDCGADPAVLNKGRRSVLSCAWGEGAEIIKAAEGRKKASDARREANRDG